jgi:DNA-binding CsgD family transcriptional regulator/GAF domain-containing protein
MPGNSRSTREERALAEITRLGHAGLDGLDLLRRATLALRTTVPFDAWCATTSDPSSNLITDAVAGREPSGPASGAEISANYFSRVYFEHDLGETVRMVREGQTVALLSESTHGDYARSGRYRLHLKPRHLGPEVYMTFTDRGLWGELHLTREEGSLDFSAREIEMLQRVAPQVAASLKFAALRLRASVAAEYDDLKVPGVLILGEGGRVLSATPNVAGFLADLGPLDAGWRAGHRLPVALQVVLGSLERAVAPLSEQDRRRVPRLRLRTRSGRWLTLDASLTEPSAERPSERVVVIGPAQAEEVAWLTVTAYELSQREEEVVRQVVRGLSTKQIAEQLYIAEHTVQRHLSNIFEKVGVRSRRDLVRRLFVEQVLPTLN